MTTSVAASALDPALHETIGRSAARLAGGGLVSQVLAALTFGSTARELGRPVLGLLVAMMSVGSVGQDLLDFGSSQWLSRELTGGRISGPTARRLLRDRAVGALIACLVAAGLAVSMGLAVTISGAVAVYVVCAVVNAGSHAKMRAAGLFRRSALHSIAERLIWLTVAAVVIACQPSDTVAACALVVAMGLAYLVSGLVAPRTVGFGGLADNPGLLRMYRHSIPFGILGLCSDLQQLDATAAAAVADLNVAGNVGIASKLTAPVAVTANALSQVTFRSVAAGGEEAGLRIRAATRISRRLSLAVLLLSSLLPGVVVGVLGGQYAGARTAIFVYGLGAAVTVLNQPLLYILTADHREKAVAWTVATAVAVGLAAGVAAVRPWGAAGLGGGYLLTQLIILCVCAALRRSRPSTAAAKVERCPC